MWKYQHCREFYDSIGDSDVEEDDNREDAADDNHDYRESFLQFSTTLKVYQFISPWTLGEQGRIPKLKPCGAIEALATQPVEVQDQRVDNLG